MSKLKILGVRGVITIESLDILVYEDFSYITPMGLSEQGVKQLELRISAIKLQNECIEEGVDVLYLNKELKRLHKSVPFSSAPISYWERAVLQDIKPQCIEAFMFNILQKYR